MKAIKFEGEIEHESIKTLLADIDKIDKDENIVLYFTSQGGAVVDQRILSNYINRQPERFEIVSEWVVSSAALDLLIDVKCKVELGTMAFAKVHISSNKIDYCDMVNNSSIGSYLLKDLKKHNTEWLAKLKRCGFTKTELNSIRKGRDVICDSKRIRHILSVLKS